MSKKTLKGELAFDFERISVQDYLDLEQAYWNNQPDRVFEVFSQLITRWSMDGDPHDISAWEQVDAVVLMLTFKAVSKAVTDEMLKPKQQPDIIIDLSQWSGRRYMEFMSVLRQFRYNEILEMLAEITTFKGVELQEGLQKISLERFIDLMQAIRYTFKDAFGEGN